MKRPESSAGMDPFYQPPVEMLYRPAAVLNMRPKTRGNYIQRRNIVYAEAHGTGLVMDVFRPANQDSGYAVVDVIGSGWYADRIILNQHIGLGVIDAFCDRGITVFAVSPGSVSLFTGFQMVHHVHAALRHIKHQAQDYDIDPHRIGIMGASAGGHLASLVALSPQPGRPNAHDPLRHWTTEVAAAAVLFPPTDLVDYGRTRFDRFQIEGLDPGRLLFHDGATGKTDAEIIEKLTALSPARVQVVNPPPFLIIHGKADPVVPWQQAEKLAASLRNAGGEINLCYHETGGHVWPEIGHEIGDMALWLEEQLSVHTS